jgi:hypothetical protein
VATDGRNMISHNTGNFEPQLYIETLEAAQTIINLLQTGLTTGAATMPSEFSIRMSQLPDEEFKAIKTTLATLYEKFGVRITQIFVWLPVLFNDFVLCCCVMVDSRVFFFCRSCLTRPLRRRMLRKK